MSVCRPEWCAKPASDLVARSVVELEDHYIMFLNRGKDAGKGGGGGRIANACIVVLDSHLESAILPQ